MCVDTVSTCFAALTTAVIIIILYKMADEIQYDATQYDVKHTKHVI